MASTAPFLEQATNTVRINFTGTLNITRALLPLVRPHGRIVNVSSMVSKLSQVSSELQKKFSDPKLTEGELVALMKQFVDDVTAGSHKEKGWSNSAYATSKLGVTALTKVCMQCRMCTTRNCNPMKPGFRGDWSVLSREVLRIFYRRNCLRLQVHAREIASSGKEDVLMNSCCPGWVSIIVASVSTVARHWGILSAYTILHLQAGFIHGICLGISNKSVAVPRQDSCCSTLTGLMLSCLGTAILLTLACAHAQRAL